MFTAPFSSQDVRGGRSIVTRAADSSPAGVYGCEALFGRLASDRRYGGSDGLP